MISRVFRVNTHALLAIAALTACTARVQAQVGGGFVASGVQGDYFAGTSTAGTPLWSRRDNRVDFDWNDYPSVTGTTAAPLASGGAFAAHWSGRIIARYSETYTFKTVITGKSALLSIRPVGSSSWRILTRTTASGTYTAPYALKAGSQYDLQLTYTHAAGTAAMRLLWSSPSTPEEAISPAVPLGVNGNATSDYDPGLIFADAIKQARQWYAGSNLNNALTASQMDANGWPLVDATVLCWDQSWTSGTYKLRFTGKADLSLGFWGWDPAQNRVSNYQYNAATNTSTADVIIGGNYHWNFGGGSTTWLIFKNTARNDGSGQAGVKNVQLMRPATQFAAASLPATALFHPLYEQLLSRFTTIRFMDYLSTNFNPTLTWADRTTPLQWTQQGNKGGSLEYLVELCNETGKDAYINIPEQANDTYLFNVANLLRYGSDGTNPYTSPQAAPTFPPLNPNLHIYVEYSNEVWNGAFSQNWQNNAAADAAVTNNTALGQIINYDGQGGAGTNTCHQRYHILRIKAASDAFRAVFGDAAMGTRIRPLLEWQYGGGWYGDEQALRFLNTYYNNADGANHVATPHPVSYYLWGGGGGWYSNSTNPDGIGAVPVTNADFESGAAGWTFSGTGGVIANSDAPAHPAPASGTHIAYLSGDGSSLQTTVTVTSADQASVYFDIALSALPTVSPILDVYWDGTQIADFNQYVNWSIKDKYLHYTTPVFAATVGTHTLRFVAHNETVKFLDNIRVSTLRAHYDNQTPGAIATVGSDALIAKAYGLHTVGYEGGFVVGGDSPTAMDYLGNVEPRANGFVQATANEFFGRGGDLPVVFNAVGGAYAVAGDLTTGAPTVFSQNTPKLAGYTAISSGLPAPVTVGIAAPATIGSAVSFPYNNTNTSFVGPSLAPVAYFPLRVSAAGQYRWTLRGTADNAATKLHLMVDGVRVPGSFSLPVYTLGEGDCTPAPAVTLAPGFHVFALYVDGPSRIAVGTGNKITVTRLQ